MKHRIFGLLSGILIFLAIYLVISYSLYKEAIHVNERHVIKQSRIALREVSDRMATFLAEQNKSLQMLAMFHEVRRDISIESFQFMEKISFMELTSSDIFLVFNALGDCVVTTPNTYSGMVKRRNYAQDKFFIQIKNSNKGFISRAIPFYDEKTGETVFFIFSFIPIHKSDSSFGGIIGLGFRVETLFYKYFKPLETNYEGSLACVTDSAGNIEVFRTPNLIRKNSSHIKPAVLPPIPAEMVDKKYHGSSLWLNSQDQKYLIIYHPIDIDGHLWIAQLKIPYGIIDDTLQPFFWKMFMLLIVLVLAAMIGVVVVIMAGKQIHQLKRQISRLEFEIDHAKKRNDVEKITSTDYFQELLRHAEILRQESQDDPP